MDRDLLARHDRKVLDSGYMVDSELAKDGDVLAGRPTGDVVVSVGPGANTCAAAGLVRVPAAGVELSVGVLGDVDVVVGELGPLVVETLWGAKDVLEGWGVDFVTDCFAIDSVAAVRIDNFEDAVCVRRKIEACRVGDERIVNEIACAVWVKVIDFHGVGFGVDELITFGKGVDVGVDSQ